MRGRRDMSDDTRETMPVRAQRLIWWLALFLTGGLAVGERGNFSFAPAEWPRLLQIARQVPGFAGPTSDQSGVVFALVDSSQANVLREYLSKEPYRNRAYGMNYSTPLKGVKAKFSAVQLITVVPQDSVEYALSSILG
jgi:hypothetical protein